MHHTTHPDIVKRLKRANGHLVKIITMIEQDRPCLEVAQQLQAVFSAIGKAKTVFVQDHIEGCLDDGFLRDAKNVKKALAEFKEIAKYL